MPKCFLVSVFALCAKNDITGADGKVILKADTVIEELATDKEGKLTFTADLPIGFEYYIKETSPALGFATTDETQEFTFKYEGAEKEKVSYSFTFEDEPTVIEITKTSLTDGKELEGAKLQVTDESGKVVDSWISGKEAHPASSCRSRIPIFLVRAEIILRNCSGRNPYPDSNPAENSSYFCPGSIDVDV